MIILASASPRRKEILEKVGLDFKVITAPVEEKIPQSKSPGETVEDLACQKAQAVARLHPHATVIGADTLVVIDGEVLGKPKDREEAKLMLERLSGRVHSVFTGVCLIKGEDIKSFHEETKVEFFKLSEGEIENYLDSGEPMDKAGAYGIQGKGCLLVKRIEGDYLNVVGLPVARLVREIKWEN